ncbi:MAG: CBS domain-containing protein, partial [Ilumatobacter sp.]
MNVQTILSAKGTEVVTIAPSATLADAIALLRARGFGALIASVDGASLDGIVSERDIVRAMADHGGQALAHDVASVMSAEVFTCAPSDSIGDLMSLMTDRRIRHLPVLDDGTLGGMVSIG